MLACVLMGNVVWKSTVHLPSRLPPGIRECGFNGSVGAQLQYSNRMTETKAG